MEDNPKKDKQTQSGYDGKPTPLMIVIASIFAIGVVVLVAKFNDPILMVLLFLLVLFL
jgi:Flp pilus assembly protein TadB